MTARQIFPTVRCILRDLATRLPITSCASWCLQVQLAVFVVSLVQSMRLVLVAVSDLFKATTFRNESHFFISLNLFYLSFSAVRTNLIQADLVLQAVSSFPPLVFRIILKWSVGKRAHPPEPRFYFRFFRFPYRSWQRKSAFAQDWVPALYTLQD